MAVASTASRHLGSRRQRHRRPCARARKGSGGLRSERACHTGAVIHKLPLTVWAAPSRPHMGRRQASRFFADLVEEGAETRARMPGEDISPAEPTPGSATPSPQSNALLRRFRRAARSSNMHVGAHSRASIVRRGPRCLTRIKNHPAHLQTRGPVPWACSIWAADWSGPPRTRVAAARKATRLCAGKPSGMRSCGNSRQPPHATS